MVTEPDFYTVTYHMQGHGTQITPITVMPGTTMTAPTAPSETGFTFGGWYKDAECTEAWDFINDTVSSNVDLYAKWTAKSYAVTLNANGGSCATKTIYLTCGQKCGDLPTPTRRGYEFMGWYDYEEEKIEADDPFAKELPSTQAGRTLTARWRVIPAEPPTVTAGEGHTLTYGYASGGNITVTATPNSGHTIVSYQWYRCDDAEKANPQAVVDATAASHRVESGLSAGVYYYYCTVTAKRADNSETAVAESDVITVTVERASLSASVGMQNYDYGDTVSTPTVSGNTANGAVKYYYSTSDTNSGGTEWKDMEPTTLNVGTYYLYAVIAETENYAGFTTAAVPFKVNQVDPIVTWPTLESIYVRDVLTDKSLVGGLGSGSFSVSGDKTWVTHGQKTTEVTFTPTDANYRTLKNKNVGITVNRRTVQRVTTDIPDITEKEYGTTLENLGLPSTVDIITDGEKTFTVSVSWSGYDAHVLTAQTLVGTLDLSAISDEVVQPTAAVKAAASVTLRPLIPGTPNFEDKTTAYTGMPISHSLTTLPTGVASVAYMYDGKNTDQQIYRAQTPPTDAGTYTVTAAFTMQAGYAKLDDAAVTLTISQAACDDKTANTSVKYGNPGTLDMSASVVEGGRISYTSKEDASGILSGEPRIEDKILHFAFVDTEENVGKTATVTLTVRSTNYQTYDVKVTLTVLDKDTPRIEADAIDRVYNAQSLTDADISGRSDTAGQWSWKSEHTPKNVGDSSSDTMVWTVVFTPSDTLNYKAVETNVRVTIRAKEVTVLAGSYRVSKIYDQTTAAGTAEGALTIEGLIAGDRVTVQATPSAYSDVNAGGQSRVRVSLMLDGEDKANYVLQSDAIEVPCAITKATPTIRNAVASVTYGAAVSDEDITAETGGVLGRFRWKDVTSYGDADVKTLQAVFTPTDTTNYETVEDIAVSVTVKKADVDPAPQDISVIYKCSVSGVQSKPLGSILPSDAGALTYRAGDPSVQGAATVRDVSVDESGVVWYTIADGAPDDLITLPVTVTSTNYQDVTVNVKIMLIPKDNQAALHLYGEDTVIYGQTLRFTTDGGSGGGAVTYSVTNGSGAATIDASGVLTPVRFGTVKVKATKAGDAEYNDISSAEIEVTIHQAVTTGEPTYTKITGADKTLADAALSAEGTFSVAGSIRWVSEDNDVLSDDTQVKKNTAYRWLFTPDNPNYTTVTGKIELYHVSGGGGGRYTISFNANGGSTVSDKTILKNNAITAPTAPTRENFIFDGWYTDKELTQKYDFTDKVTEPLTLYAKWIEAPAEPIPSDNETDEPWQNPFVDVSIHDWFCESVEYVTKNKLFEGATANMFEPSTAMSRGMLVTVLYRAEGEPTVNRSIPFADVSANDYFADAVIWAVQNGVVNGVSETAFAPNDPISREQFAVMLYRYAMYKGYDVSVGEDTNLLSYADAKDVSAYAIGAMQYAVGLGVIKGKTQNMLEPKASATRAEVAAMLQRFDEKTQ